MKLKLSLLFFFLVWVGLITTHIAAHAKDFPIFDAQVYNGSFYPMIDIIEWSQTSAQGVQSPSHMEFHIHHSNVDPIELSAVSGKKGGKPVLWLVFYIRSRGEKACRHVLAPFHFKEGEPLIAYKDTHIGEYDNIYVSNYPLQVDRYMQPYKLAPYEPCDDSEINSNMPGPETTEAKNKAAPNSRMPASVMPANIPPKEGKGVGIDYENSAMPYSF